MPEADPRDPAALLARLAGVRVVVLGDVMLDRYVEGEVRRISPEAPIPVLRRSGGFAVLGGAANVARNVAAMGGRAALVGAVGEDGPAAELARLAAADAIEAHLVPVPGWPSTIKTRFVSHGHQLLRLDEEEPLGAEVAPSLIAAFAAALPGAAAVVLSDYAKGVVGDAVLTGAIATARAQGVPVVADPKRVDFAAYRGVTVLTPNQAEAARASGVEGSDDAAVAEAGRRALLQAAAEAVLVTRSERGLTVVRAHRPPLHLPTHAQAVADVSGAGDTLVAALALGLGAGATLEDAARLANLAAGIVVGKPGTATVSAAELAAAVHHAALESLDDRVAPDWASAAARLAAWRAAGLRVGFTNGCFDLIHPGHVRLLAAARAQCDRLIVALNTDASVRRLKGPGRPVQAEAARAVVLAGMASVDLVVLFDQDTPEALIARLLPDLLFKGADYTEAQVVGGDIVRAHGGQVRLIPLEPGHSTTAMVGRMR